MAQTNTETAAERFVEKWGNSELSQRVASHEHFIDLCRLIDQPTPASADATGEEYTFEKPVKVTPSASSGCVRLSRVICLVALVGCILPTSVARSQASPTSQPSVPQATFVGFYFNDLSGLDLKKSTYTADFYVWMRWRGDNDPSNIEFLNGSLDIQEHPDRLEAAGFKYVCFHCRGTFHTGFDYRRYPLDEHLLVLEMEDGKYESGALRYVVDGANMQHLPAATLAGWTCDQPQFEVRDNTYETNFGDPTRPFGSTATYSRLYCSIRIAHRSFSIYIKTFLALFISVAIAFLSFVLKPSETDPRFGVGVAAIFAAVSSEIVTTSNLPDMPYLTLADKVHLFSLFIIFLSLLQSCLSLRLFRNGNPTLATRIDRISLFAFPICYAVVVASLTTGH